ncbi:hypothetical protein [Solidesulfovibrio alcoholivorans]|uniref:hypothetical protein n=1 Tax=Solidesulfovibrio alcoholivorans TaxID=81406 RepID=UPI000497E28F|nr:hypothetical protein [Solidesulfovibrio alcoholivorans]
MTHQATTIPGCLFPWNERAMCNALPVFVLCCFIVLSWAGVALASLTVLFDTSKYSGDVWLQIQDPNAGTGNALQATYNSGQSAITYGTHQTTDDPPQTVTNLMSTPVKLSAIGSGGLTVNKSISCVYYLFYDDPSGGTNYLTTAPSVFTTPQRFQQFEMTMNGGSGDQGNLTNIDAFTAPLSIKSYQSNPLQAPSGPVLQSTGYGNWTANQIAGLLVRAGASGAAVLKDSSGKLIRYIGPSIFDPGNAQVVNPWPSFVPYAQSLTSTTTTLQRANAFGAGNATWASTQTYTFGIDMQATTASDGTITASGKLTAAVSNPASVTSPNPALPAGGAWTNVSITISPTTGTNGIADYNAAIYGQSGSPVVDPQDSAKWILNNTAITLGPDWDNFQTFCMNTLGDPSLAENPSTNASLQDLQAYLTTLNMALGELTTGLLGGYFGSTYQVTFEGTTAAIGTLPSQDWWQMDPLVGFSQIQSDPTHYNRYASVIWTTSNNTVYGVPYSDRFGSGPLVNTVLTPDMQTSVGYWVVGVGAPATGASLATPAPDILLLLNK